MRLCKLIHGVLAVAVAAAVLCSCNSSKTGVPTAAVKAGTDGKITAEPLDLTIFMHIWPTAFNYDKMVIYQEAFKKTNIKLTGTASEASSDSNQEFNIMLASSPLPDIIHGTKVNINKSAVDGAMIPLDDLIDKYAPHIKAFLDENSWAKKGSAASDGKLYYIPHIFEGKPSMGFYIRRDWLDKLGLKTPATVSEYHDALKAFRDRDPNGNGIQDEVPYFYRDKGIDGLLQLWGAKNDWYVDDQGKVLHGKMQPAFKVAMTNLAVWYQEGLIDKEIYSRGKQAREVLLGNNQGGSTHDWFTSTGSFNDSLKDKISGFDFQVIPPPADINGLVKEEFSRSQLDGYGWGISKDNKYPVETIKFFDYWFTGEGSRLFTYGIEGTDYTMVDGKPVFTDIVRYAPETSPTYLRERGQTEIGAVSRIEGEFQVMNPHAREGFQMYADNNYCTEKLPNLSFNAEEERIIKEKGEAIKTYMQEVQQKWLFGNESVEGGYDAYLNQLKGMGFDELQAAYQSAYDRYISQ